MLSHATLLTSLHTSKKAYLCDTGKRYGSLDFHKAPWPDVKEELAKLDWSELEECARNDITQALGMYHDKVLCILEKLVPPKKVRPTKFKMPRDRKKLWRRLSAVNEKMGRSTSVKKMTWLLKEKRKLESKLKQSYSSSNWKLEKEAISRIKKNSKAFYSFAKSRQRTRANIGPFIDPATGKPNQDPSYAAEVLRQQYNSVFSQPRPEWTVHDTSSFFQVQDGATNSLSNIKFNHVDIELACEELSGNSAPGPDGVPALLLKECRKELSHPLTTFWRASLDQGVIPDELLLVQISPLHKGGSRADPAQFRPVALTSHLIKSFERVVRKVLFRYLEVYGIFPDGFVNLFLYNLNKTFQTLIKHQLDLLKKKYFFEKGVGDIFLHPKPSY